MTDTPTQYRVAFLVANEGVEQVELEQPWQTVLEHGGDMWVESQPGRGARFSFRLPGAQVAHGVQV